MTRAHPPPLSGVRVVDLTRYGPGPYCALLLADLGADVVVVDDARELSARGARQDTAGGFAELLEAVAFMRRGMRRIALDLRHPDGQAVIARLIARADVLLEGFRPGVAARLGLDPPALVKQHPRLVACSLSGYGQQGPYRDRAGHDINYLALGGLLGLSGTADGPPALPGTLVADLAAGGQAAAIAVLGALLGRERGGAGQAIDVSLQEGVAALSAPLLALHALGRPSARGGSDFTGAAPWYAIYATADDRHLAVGAIEPWFWATLCRTLDHPEWIALQFERASWPRLSAELAAVFLTATLAEWVTRFEGVDACVTPVLTIEETLIDPQLAQRETFAHGLPHRVPLMASVTRECAAPVALPGAHAGEILGELGYDDAERERLLRSAGIGNPGAEARSD